MQELTIDDEFRFLLTAIGEKTYALLEESLFENGTRDPNVCRAAISRDARFAGAAGSVERSPLDAKASILSSRLE